MFGIGFGEMLVIGVLILIAVGPDKLPTMVKTVAKTYRQFRRAATDIRASTGIDDFLRDEELKELAELRKQKLMMMAEGKPGAAKPGVVAGKPGVVAGKPGAVAGKPTMPGKPDGPGGADEGAPIPATKVGGAASGLLLKQRLMEVPPQGVDVAEAQLAEGGAASIPATHVGTGIEKA